MALPNHHPVWFEDRESDQSDHGRSGNKHRIGHHASLSENSDHTFHMIRSANVRYGPKADICIGYSITSSARPISVLGTLRPSALAVLRLMHSSPVVDCLTGKSAGFSPFKTRPV